MKKNIYNDVANVFKTLQDAITKENITKDMYADYCQREAMRVDEGCARRNAQSIKIITEKSMILETVFLNVKETYELRQQYERALIAQWGGVIDDENVTYDIIHPSLKSLSAYVAYRKDIKIDERMGEMYEKKPELSRSIRYHERYLCPQELKYKYKINAKFRPDLKLLINPPYPGFCKNLLYWYVSAFSLHLKNGKPGEPGKLENPGEPLKIGFRHPVSKMNYEEMCEGLEIFMPYMCKAENGKIVIHAEGYLSCDSYYSSILVNPKTGGAELVIYRKGRFDHRHNPNALESRTWLNEDRIIKEFPSIRIALLNIIACSYRAHFKNRDI